MHSNIHNPTKLGLPSFNSARIETLPIYLFANLCPFSLCCSRANGAGCCAAIDVACLICQWGVSSDMGDPPSCLYWLFYFLDSLLSSTQCMYLLLLTHLTWTNLNSLTFHLSCRVLGTRTFWYTGQWRSKTCWLYGLFVDWKAYILPVADWVIHPAPK